MIVRGWLTSRTQACTYEPDGNLNAQVGLVRPRSVPGHHRDSVTVSTPQRRRDPAGVAIGMAASLLIGGLVAVAARWGPDWPAQEFRAWVASEHGIVAWTSQWYAGQPLLGYSVLYPPVAALFGAPLTGLLAVVVTTTLASWLAPPASLRQRVFPLSVAASLIECLLIGQVPFLLGIAFATGAVVAVLRGKGIVWIAVCAAGCGLASPLAGVGLGLAVPAIAVLNRRGRAMWLLACLAGPVVAKFAGGAGGPYPFPFRSWLAVLAFAAISVLLTRWQYRALNLFAVSYLGAATLAFVVPNPVGGNIVRLGTVLSIPMAVWFVPCSRGFLQRGGAAILTALAVLWPSWSFTSAALRGARDPSQNAAYYTGLITFLSRQDALTGRLEIPFTREHWESLYVARAFPIARGWERQTDLLYNDVLYRPLTADGYRRWLDNNAIALVALSRSPIDFGGRAERDLLAHPPSYLVPVWHDANWQVWRVRDPHPLASGAARLIAMGSSTMALRFAGAGTAIVRVRYQPLWQISDGDACLDATPDGWLRVHATRAGVVRLHAGLDGLLQTGNTCTQ
jgi:hypothetical protein